eukprot:TRINITY_DN67484_c3_g1_i1.p1 TRINITY_DN67484_c3_g1~~TRINITY_DN67484_c3_g1_i1.p1  ORF type:complete len:153 (-),score=15.62 TRINITY_DN67484_c3_g1_i1:724-1182(-)
MQSSASCLLILCSLVVLSSGLSQRQDERHHHGTTELKTEETYIPPGCETARKTQVGDLIDVKYVLRLPDGTGFAQAATYKFRLGQGEVIEGWDKGLVGMCVGENRKLIVPSNMGFGGNEYDPDRESNDPNAQRLRIPPHSVLIFDTEILSIE